MRSGTELLKCLRNINANQIFNTEKGFYFQGLLVFGIVLNPLFNWERYYTVKSWIGRNPTKITTN